jgi:surface antigen
LFERKAVSGLDAKDASRILNTDIPATEVSRIGTNVTIFRWYGDDKAIVGIDGDVTARDIASLCLGGDTTATAQYQQGRAQVDIPPPPLVSALIFAPFIETDRASFHG